MMEALKVYEGFKVATVGRHNNNCTNGYPIWTGKIYVALRRKKDDKLTWRFDDFFGGSASDYGPSRRLIDALQIEALRLDIIWMPRFAKIKHGAICPKVVIKKDWINQPEALKYQ